MKIDIPWCDTLIFDTWNVVIFFDQEKVKDKILSYSQLPYEEWWRILDDISKSNIFRLWKICPESFFELLKHVLHLDGIDYKNFCDIWNSEFIPNYNLIDTIRSLNARVLLITDMNIIHYEYLMDRYPDVIGIFEDFVTSCKLWISKKDPKFLEELTRIFGLTPNRTLYIDDKGQLIENAKQRWFHGITYKTWISIEMLLQEYQNS